MGIRIRAPYDLHVEWYARHLGFGAKCRTYEPNPDPLKNFPPWVTASVTPTSRVDINWIINANTPPLALPGGAAGEGNVLCQGGALRAGILYAAFGIREEAGGVCAALQAAGVDCILDTELAAGAQWADFPRDAVYVGEQASVLVRDLCGNYVRLVTAA